MSGEVEQWIWPPAYDDYVPDPSQEHWFPHRETMDPSQRDELILGRLQELMRYAYDRSPFYRNKWTKAGLEVEDIRSLEDFEQVPVVTKEEIRLDQAEHPPWGSYLCVEPDDVHRVHGTSGTTGRPTGFGISRADWVAIAHAHARVMWGMGIRPTDTVFVGAFFSLYLGSWGALAGAERLGARVFPFGAGAPGQTRRAVSWMAQIKPTVFYGTPSYALHIAETAAEDGVSAASFGLRKMFFSGEPGAAIPAIRARLEDAFQAEVYDSGSMAEVTPWMNLAETTSRVGMLCWQDIAYTEVVDPVSHRRQPFGAEGTPVYTTLERTSQPMIRLLSNDLTRWEAPGSPCGRTYPVLPDGIYGRIDDMITIRGENVYPGAVQDVLARSEGYGGEHRIVIARGDAMDSLAIQVEATQELFAQGEGALADWCATNERELSVVLGIGATVTAVAPGTFERTQLKASRVVDNRDLWRSMASQAAER